MFKYILLVLTFMFSFAQAQELMAEVKVDYSQVQSTSTTAYTALQKGLRDFINTTKWTDKNFKVHEKIECNFTIVIREKVSSNRYKGTLLVQSRRPVFNSGYYTPILNINDKDFEFNYTEYQQLIFNPRRFSGDNLTDVIGYYIYLILGYDADSFAKSGGTPYFDTSLSIAGNAENSQFDGWSQINGPRSRSGLINDILAPENKKLRDAFYTYNRQGLDQMMTNEINAKNTIGRALLSLKYFQNSNNYAQNYPLDIFFQAKKGEIAQIFSGGLKTNVRTGEIKDLFNTISPINSSVWDQIK